MRSPKPNQGIRREGSERAKARGRSRGGAWHTVHFECNAPQAGTVCVAGSFNNWQPAAGKMAPVGNGRWVADLKLKQGTYEYRLVVDGRWIADPSADHAVLNPAGQRTSLVTVR